MFYLLVTHHLDFQLFYILEIVSIFLVIFYTNIFLATFLTIDLVIKTK